MILDIFLASIILYSAFLGYSKGVLYALMQLIAIFLGVVLALNFNSALALKIAVFENLPKALIPSVSFVIILLAVILASLLIRAVAEQVLKIVKLNFINKTIGAGLYILSSLFIASTLLFFIEKTPFISLLKTSDSKMYPIIKPLGPYLIDSAHIFIPKLSEYYIILNNSIKNL